MPSYRQTDLFADRLFAEDLSISIFGEKKENEKGGRKRSAMYYWTQGIIELNKKFSGVNFLLFKLKLKICDNLSNWKFFEC